MNTSTKAKCHAYAAQHFLTVEVRKDYYTNYSVDLPEGLITESGRTGHYDLGGSMTSDAIKAIKKHVRKIRAEG